MDLFHIGVFNSMVQSWPIICMAFALTSDRTDTCKVEYVGPSPCRSSRIQSDKGKKKSQFTAYDFWCEGLDTKTFPLIDKEDWFPYRHPLACTRDNSYDVRSEGVDYSARVIEHKCGLLHQFDPLLETGV
ncbi:hypothetical protein BC826DRAFT_966885 [Russula brevipes]|nr:hypothetical protein BC826DRAFT_966885 [Russula brevipes]